MVLVGESPLVFSLTGIPIDRREEKERQKKEPGFKTLNLKVPKPCPPNSRSIAGKQPRMLTDIVLVATAVAKAMIGRPSSEETPKPQAPSIKPKT